MVCQIVVQFVIPELWNNTNTIKKQSRKHSYRVGGLQNKNKTNPRVTQNETLLTACTYPRMSGLGHTSLATDAKNRSNTHRRLCEKN
jgi:hypothetical protein